MNTRQRGFTLIELMVATAITGILAATAYPSFQGPLLKARRIDGITTLLQLQMSQERWFSNHRSYATQAEMGSSVASSQRYYEIQVTEATPTGFSAVARGTGTQAGDNACRVLRLTVEGGHTSYASGADERTANDSAATKRCWNL
ncbi:MAG: prepilin-type N-terminal cleavage/methylation domain-containing protein [Rhizobacter sp.]|nr:prepilin-type N-terminal cleavage/methylation domain-containing protein [Rhizobacter sp.]